MPTPQTSGSTVNLKRARRREQIRLSAKRRRLTKEAIRRGYDSDDIESSDEATIMNTTTIKDDRIENTDFMQCGSDAFDDGVAYNSEDDESTDEEYIYDSDCSTDADSDTEVEFEAVIDHSRIQHSPYLEKPLYEGAEVTVRYTMLIILYFVVICSIPVSAVSKLLHLLHYLLPMKNELKKTKHLFYQYFGKHLPNMNRYHACRKCRKVRVGSKKKCENCGSKIDAHFLAQPLSDALITNFRDPDYWKKCQYFREEFKYQSGVCTDIYDGSTYQKIGLPISIEKGGFTLYANTDGANKYKSSSWCVWPIYLVISEISKDERYKVENVIFIGLWYGSKPDMNLFLSIFVADLIRLDDGIPVCINNEDVLLRARLLGTVLDLPARKSLYCMTGHNGKCGCSWCLNQGKSINKRYCFPINEQDPDPLRTIENVNIAYEMLRQNTSNPEYTVDGLKDITVLNVLPYWHMVYSDCLDAMHQFQGLFKTLTSLWSKPKFKTYAFYLKSQKWDEFNTQYALQKNLSVFKRTFRSVKDHASHFKAMEALVFLLYSYPLLQNTLKDNYFRHHMILVECITQLFSGPLEWKQLDEIEKKLFTYVLQFQVCLYSIMTNRQ
jgi:hypothetical protein